MRIVLITALTPRGYEFSVAVRMGRQGIGVLLYENVCGGIL
jgi:hypothetical protein